MLENCDKIMHLHFNFDACPMHSPFGFVHMTHQILSVHALLCHNSLAKGQVPCYSKQTIVIDGQYTHIQEPPDIDVDDVWAWYVEQTTPRVK